MRIAICEDIKEEAEDLAKKVNAILKEENHDCEIDVFLNPEQFEKSGAEPMSLCFLTAIYPIKTDSTLQEICGLQIKIQL